MRFDSANGGFLSTFSVMNVNDSCENYDKHTRMKMVRWRTMIDSLAPNEGRYTAKKRASQKSLRLARLDERG
jgi:hypothetical protein